MYECDGVLKMGLTSLPLSDLHHPVTFTYRLQHGFCFGDGIGHRLFTINVLARLQGMNQLQAMPVVRGPDDHHIDVLLVKELAVVPVTRWFFPPCLDQLCLPPV